MILTNFFVFETKQIVIFAASIYDEKMHILSQFLKEQWHIGDAPDCGIVFSVVNRDRAYETNRMNGRLAFYAFTVVVDGQAVITYNDRRITLSKHDLYTYTPGVPIIVDNATDNYLAYSILAEEDAFPLPPNPLS